MFFKETVPHIVAHSSVSFCFVTLKHCYSYKDRGLNDVLKKEMYFVKSFDCCPKPLGLPQDTEDEED